MTLAAGEAVQGFLRQAGIAATPGPLRMPDGPPPALAAAVGRAFARFPYENATKILRLAGPAAERRRLPETVWREHLAWGAGGTCFSLTCYLLAILDRLGFEARPVMGDMASGPDLHCAVLIEAAEGGLLLDPGYLMGEPLRLPASGRTEAGAVTLVSTGAAVDVSTREATGLKWRYRLKLAPVSPAEFESHWLRSFDRLNSLVVSRRDGQERLYLHGRLLRRTGPQGSRNYRIERRSVPAQVHQVFGLDPALVERAHAAWAAARDHGQAL